MLSTLADVRYEYLVCRGRGHGWLHRGGIPMKQGNLRFIEYLDECPSCNGWRKFFVNPKTGENVFRRQDWRPEDYKLDARYSKAECRLELIRREAEIAKSVSGTKKRVLKVANAI